MTQSHNNSATITPPAFDQVRAEAAVRELLIAVGEDPDRHGLVDTPARVARAYREFRGESWDAPMDVDELMRGMFELEADPRFAGASPA